MSKFNITVAFTEPEPDQQLVRLVAYLLHTNSLAGNLIEDKNINLIRLTEQNIGNFFEKTRSTVKEPLQVSHSIGNTSKPPLDSFTIEKEQYRPDLLVFDMYELSKKPKLITILFKTLKNCDCSVLFLNINTVDLTQIVLKYDGTETTINSIFSFYHLFPLLAKNATVSTLTSPLAFKKSQIAAEKEFVRKVCERYGDLGFIKLPFNTVADFLTYALKNKADLLILPQTDLNELSEILVSKNHIRLFAHLPSIFLTSGYSSYAF